MDKVNIFYFISFVLFYFLLVFTFSSHFFSLLLPAFFSLLFPAFFSFSGFFSFSLRQGGTLLWKWSWGGWQESGQREARKEGNEREREIQQRQQNTIQHRLGETADAD